MKPYSLHRRSDLPAMAIAIATLSLAACGGGATAGTTAAPAPSEPARFTYGPFNEVYEVSSNVKLDQGPAGSSDFSMRYYLHATTAQTGGASRLTLTIDSVGQATGPTTSPADIAGAAGARFTGLLSPQGEIMNFQGGETGNQLVDQLSDGLSRFFPRIPEGGAAPGATWSDSVVTNTGAGQGVDIHLTLHVQYAALDWEDFRGERALHVRATGEYALTGGGSSGGADFTLDGTGSRHTDLYLGTDGIYLGAITADTSESTALVPAAGMSIPITQIRADTVRVLR